MRFLEYIWASILFDTPWAMGHWGLQLVAWAIGMIAPVLFAIGLFFNANKTVLVLAFIATVTATALIATWLLDLDYWMLAPPCGGDACDNDGEIRTLFAAGAILLPIILPSIIAGPIAFVTAIRRVITQRKTAQLKVN